MNGRRAAILALHKVGAPSPGGWETWNYISRAKLREFLEILVADSWTVVDHETFVMALDPSTAEPVHAVPERLAMVTFDDGYASMLHEAAPVLEEFGMPAVLFVPTDYVGRTNVFDLDNEPEEPMCTWDELRELQDRGWSIQSHAKTHTTFSSLSTEERRTELEVSKQLLEDGLGRRVDGLAFPYGDSGGDESQVAETQGLLRDLGYRVAYRYKGGVASIEHTPRYAMTRIALGPDSDLRHQLAKTTAKET